MHKQLLKLSKEKSEAIKLGDMDKLSKLLMKERKQLQAIGQLEEQRQQLVEEVFQTLKIDVEEKTVSELLKHIDDENEKVELEQAVTALVEVIVQLKQTEQLNTELLQQSMQFVQLSLDMLQPSMKNINYNEKSTGNDTVKQSVFDSKA